MSGVRCHCLMPMDLQDRGCLFTQQQDLIHLLEVSGTLSAHSLVMR